MNKRARADNRTACPAGRRTAAANVPCLGALRPALTRFIERIVARRTEGRDIAGAEAADGRPRRAALRWRAESRSTSPRSQESCVSASKRRMASSVVAEEIEAQRIGRSRRPQIDDAAAQREIARLAHRAGAHIAVGGQERDQLVVIDICRRPARRNSRSSIAARGGTRCRTALIVVTTTAGPEFSLRCASAASVASRVLSISGLGDTRS